MAILANFWSKMANFGPKWPFLVYFWTFFQNSALTFADFLHKVDSQYSNVETVSGYPVKIQNGQILAIGHFLANFGHRVAKIFFRNFFF